MEVVCGYEIPSPRQAKPASQPAAAERSRHVRKEESGQMHPHTSTHIQSSQHTRTRLSPAGVRYCHCRSSAAMLLDPLAFAFLIAPASRRASSVAVVVCFADGWYDGMGWVGQKRGLERHGATQRRSIHRDAQERRGRALEGARRRLRCIDARDRCRPNHHRTKIPRRDSIAHRRVDASLLRKDEGSCSPSKFSDTAAGLMDCNVHCVASQACMGRGRAWPIGD